MISRALFRSVESRLYRYEAMRQRVEEFEQMREQLTTRVDRGMPRGNAVRGDPTALMAMLMSAPPRQVQECKDWIRVIDLAAAQLNERNRELGRLGRLFYRELAMVPVEERERKLCRLLGIGRTALRLRRRRIVERVYLQAVYEKLLVPDQESLSLSFAEQIG